jgi:DEAD/DEAH box helicase domain-containing protein
MFALHQAQEVKASVMQYLRDTFHFQDSELEAAFEALMQHPKEGLFRGAYVSLKLPFIRAASAADSPLAITPDFPPYAHQLKAFERLQFAKKHRPEPTILTTGTGSGKTESFLYPILDYCEQQKRNSGIKAIILYPMNALATDQASRIAEIIWKHPKLKGKVNVGLLIGLGKDKKTDYTKVMTENKVIEDRETILKYPPDILLTNFKMLDYALMQQDFQTLWFSNIPRPKILQYLVLDELHTYDGAQGTDVANLIRRLKLKLNIPVGSLCPVGTSATIGTSPEAKVLLAKYAENIFGEFIEANALIGEERQTAEQFFERIDTHNFVPTAKDIYDNRILAGDDYNSYLQKQKTLWRVSDLTFNNDLKSLTLIQLLLSKTAKGIVSLAELMTSLKSENEAFRNLAVVENSSFDIHRGVILSLMALLSTTKVEGRPMLSMQVQLWLRELSNVLRQVRPEAKFILAADHKAETEAENKTLIYKGLPPYFCRECNHSGWIAVYDEGRNQFTDDVNKVYRKYFANNNKVYFVVPYSENVLRSIPEEYDTTNALGPKWITSDLTLHEKEVENSFQIIGFQKKNGLFIQQVCPHCNAKDTIAIIGTRAATLNSVATSQMLATNVNEAPLSKRKLLAFTNSVQDAAHHAGFIKARNYSFTFRTAVQQVINEQKTPVSLQALAEAFTTYWQEKADESGRREALPYFVRFLPSDKKTMVDLSPESKQWQTPAFLTEFNRRLSWNIFAEFGYNAIIGRTLEKTGSAGAFFETAVFTNVYNNLKKWFATQQIPDLKLPKEALFTQFLTVFLHRMRIRGAIEHPYLDTYRTDKSGYFSLTVQRNPQYFMMRNFGKRTRLPKLLTDQRFRQGKTIQTAFDVTERESVLNWFHAYFLKYFEWLTEEDKNLINDFYSQLLTELEAVGILNKKVSTGLRNYALSSEIVKIGQESALFNCNNCGHRLHVHPTNSVEMNEAKCMSFRCTGHYLSSDKQSTSYYRQVYNRQNVPLINAFEHTGLLDRNLRESVEERFKSTDSYQAYNVLVATSTLEMGIDIGDLDNTSNISIPPQPANFLQRVGRAGRKSGTAMILNVALNKPHDAFYFEAPKEMMEGAVYPPGCYLSAKDILKRHFLAFCIDCWTVADGNNRIPKTIRNMNMAALNVAADSFFVNEIIDFIEENEEELKERFKKHYPTVNDAVFDGIWFLLNDTQLFGQLRQTFLDIKNRLQELYQKQTDTKIERNKLPKEDPDRKLLSNELSNIKGTIKNIQQQQVLEHLTNVGLLPNYAFPETGVELSAVVRKQYDDNTEESTADEFSLVRPAQSALRELIPENFFYTHGYKLQIQRVEIPNKAALETYRFCSNCDHLEKEYEFVNRNCPKCHDGSWSQPMNQHTFVKQQLVTSYNDEQKSAIDDSKDERVELISRTSQHFDFSDGRTKGAWAMVEIPFGVEFVPEVTIRTVNLGIVEDRKSGDEIEINEKKVSRRGYLVCKHCQRSTSLLHKEDGKPKDGEQYHFGYCPHRSVVYDGSNTDIFHEIFLYRSLKTEVLKILIPVYELESDADMKMFKAGLELGLKQYFGGNPQHIHIADYQEKNEITGKIDRYLILYDTIPGGTGYLEELFEKQSTTKPFNQIIESAYEQIKNCGCQEKGQDGCYRCIYTYKNQFNRHELSRRKAEGLFEKIYLASENWQYLDGGLNTLSADARLEESKLEELFVYNLKQRIETESDKDNFSNWRFEIIKNAMGKNNYRITTSNNLVYEIRPQINFDAEQGIEYATRADFVIYSLTKEIADDFQPIAIYLDGFAFHASEAYNMVFRDLEKRKHLVEKGYQTWTLSWNDVRFFEQKKADVFYKKSLTWMEKEKLKESVFFKDFPAGFLTAKNSMERLFWLLENPEEKMTNFVSQFFYDFQEKINGKAYQLIDFEKAKNNDFDLTKFQFLKSKNDCIIYLDAFEKTEFFIPFLGINLSDFQLNGKVILKQNETEFTQKDWQHFWQLFNLLQTIKNVEFIVHNQLVTNKKEVEKVAETRVEKEDIILENFDKSVHDIIIQLQKNKIPFDDISPFDLMEKNRVIASAGLGIPKYKIVIDVFEQLDEKYFEKAGFRVIKIEDFSIDLIH